eukprot:TRINITY_DN68333_c0_g1_i1.p1 TRINITY_DN68333_c0_g1~~TRINITY_DN68333_c0_g1_i1.p1  ORF type:complete len:464 (-),score=90.71 TRINITY_DN68333_c0_g1_i1:24-1415(-)
MTSSRLLVGSSWLLRRHRRLPACALSSKALRRCFAAAGAAETTAASPLTDADPNLDTNAGAKLLYPPKPGDRRKIDAFLRAVDHAILVGQELELEARGGPAVQTVMRALALGSRAVEFEVEWQSSDVPGREHERSLRFRASPGPEWKEYMTTDFKGVNEFPVERDTRVLQLAQSISSELFDKDAAAVRVLAAMADTAALNVLCKALATAPLVRNRLVCIPNIISVKRDEGKQSTLFVYVRPNLQPMDSSSYASLPAATKAPGKFRAIPPGRNADDKVVKRFADSVHDRLRRGDVVEIEAVGPEAVEQSLRAFCQMQASTAAFSAEWVESDSAKGDSKRLKGLLFRAQLGDPWGVFNATDFGRSQLVYAGPATFPAKLASELEGHVKQDGAVSVHAFADNAAAVHAAARGFASLTDILRQRGEKVLAVPSLGYTKGRQQVLRLYIHSRSEGTEASRHGRREDPE